MADGGTREFRFSNGECNESRVSQTIPARDATRAFGYICEREELPPGVIWHRDF
jgi:hypothetical protein